MSPKLCSFCRNLPCELFRPEHDAQGRMGGPEIYLPPLNFLRETATQGCNLCRIWTSKPSIKHLPDLTLQFKRIRLRRSQLEPQMSVTGFIDFDDIFVVFFSRLPPEWTNVLFPFPIASSAGERAIMRRWMELCRSEHPKCKIDSDKTTIGPSRILDLQAFEGSNDLQLVEYAAIAGPAPARFVCLSHCWGDPSTHPRMTNKSSLSQHCQRIPFTWLSKTFQDAIDLSRQPNERYLWIDSLCIVQDDPQDWEREAAKMATIYGSATLTMAALGSENGNGGCRVVDDPPEYVDVPTGHLRVRFYRENPGYWHTLYGDNPYKHAGFGGNPLRTRAWTLQERHLSTRNVHFAKNMILWECKTLKGSSILPWGHHDPPDDMVPWPVRNLMEENLAPDGQVDIRARWYEVVEDYSSRFMTKETDKMSALSGVAAVFSKLLLGANYHAGVFQCGLPSALLWRSQQLTSRTDDDLNTRKLAAFLPRRPMKYRAPSWSWAALEGAVTYDSQQLSNLGGSRPDDNAALLDYNAPRVIEVETSHAGIDIFGAIKSSSLRIIGRVIVLHVKWECDVDRPQGYIPRVDLNPDMRLLVAQQGLPAGVVYPDIINELQFSRAVTCHEVRPEPFWADQVLPRSVYGWTATTPEEWRERGPTAMGLALLPDENLDGVYRRVGLVRWVKRDLFDEVKRLKITIV